MESKNIFRLGVIFFYLSILYSCESNDDSRKDKVVFENVILLCDVTNRITNPSYNKPIHDSIILNQILDYFKINIVKPGSSINPQHIISYYNLNPLKKTNCDFVSKIDLNSVPNSMAKAAYVNSKGDGQTLTKDIDLFKRRIECEYGLSDISGDILNSLNTILIQNENVKTAKPSYDSVNDVSKEWRNTILLFTDGYLEFNNMEDSKHSTNGKIDEIRKYCFDNKVSPEKAIELNAKFQFLKIINPAFSNSRLFLLETFDRTIDKTTGVSSLKFSDEYILKALWKNWAKTSGFVEFEYFSFINTKTDILPRIRKLFIAD